MTKIFDAFSSLIKARERYRARGFINIDCPACGDRRHRGGFAPTAEGGFRYYCFNGGCEYHNRPTGWEPGNGLYGRVRRLFELLGGNINSLPLAEVLRVKPRTVVKDGQEQPVEDAPEVTWSFPKESLPKETLLLENAVERDPRALAVFEYLLGRGEFFLGRHPWMWSPAYPHFLIIPYLHFGRIVGYLGRNIKKEEGAGRFIQKSPTDYLFNQHLIQKQSGTNILVMEGVMNAIAVEGIATRGSTLTKRQINLLATCGKTPILLPDFKDEEWVPYLELAETQGWPITIPDWGRSIKGVNEAIALNGYLHTLEVIVQGVTTNYLKARIQLNARG